MNLVRLHKYCIADIDDIVSVKIIYDNTNDDEFNYKIVVSFKSNPNASSLINFTSIEKAVSALDRIEDLISDVKKNSQ
jgi:hypothetical protein